MIFILWIVRSEVSQSYPTLCDPMDCSLLGSSIHGIFQARILEWAAISFSRRTSPPRDQTRVSHIVGRRFTIWATRAEQFYSWDTLKMYVKVKATQSCLTLCDPMVYAVCEILQVWILEWVVFPFSRGSFQPRDWTRVSCIAGRFFTNWAIREA